MISCKSSYEVTVGNFIRVSLVPRRTRTPVSLLCSVPVHSRQPRCKHIDWTQGLKCDHQVWPWPWPWPWNFKVKYIICYISAKNGPIATKRKANISIELQASNVTNGVDLDHDLDFWIVKVKCDLDLWPHTWRWPWIFMVKFLNSFLQNGRADWHWTKGVGVGHSWPWPWPFGDQGQVWGSTR